MRATSVEHDVDVKAPARAADGPRPDGAVAERDDALPLSGLGAAPPGLLQARMLLGLQAMAGNAAVAGLIETRKPIPPISPPALEERREEDESQGGGAEPGTPIEDRPAPAIPDVRAAEPAAGLAQVGTLPPAQLLSSLGKVSTAAEREATDEHEQLAANAPQRPRHFGAPATVESPASARPAVADGPAPTSIPMMPEGRDVPVNHPPALPATPELPIANGQLPTRDPGLELRPGPLPPLSLEGSADPALIQQQRSRILGSIERDRAAGQHEARQPLGEDEIFPTAPAETLRGSVGDMPRVAGQAAAQPESAEEDEAASIIAEQEKGAEIQSAVGTGLASLAGQREEYAQQTAGERARADAEMSQLEQANSQEQAGERAAAKLEVAGLRGQWTTAQQELLAGAQHEADAKTTETVETVSQERSAAEKQATTHYAQGQQEAQKARHEAELQAASERQKAQGQNQGGLLGLIGSAAQSLFDKAKQAVQSVFDRARQLVRGAIERAHQLATAVMERARQAIVGAIRIAGTVLTAIGDRVLVAFPALRDRFRKAIQQRIAAAELAVNKLANVLKHAVQSALNLLGATLSAAIALLHRGMQAAIDGVRGVVHGALDFARGAIAALGTFAVLIKDIAASPGHWISNLAAAARDGIRNHLWPDLKGAIRGWFSEKVDSMLGLGAGVWNLLNRGRISVTHVASIAWDGIKSMIPQTVIWVLIEKLVALIVPAAAAVMLIVQALQAAWGSLSRILQAVDAFIGFLKGVRWGNAGPLFGKAIAAGAVAVVEFVSQFLLQRLMGAVGGVASKLRALAKRIGTGLAAAGRGIKRGAEWLGGKAGQVGGLLKGSARRTVAAPQVQWHTWRLGQELRKAHPPAFEKLRQVKADPSLDPTLKLQFLKTVRSRMGPGVDARALMTRVVAEHADSFCLKGALIAEGEIASVAPLTKLVSLRSIFEKRMLTAEYRERFATFDEWKAEITRNPRSFDPTQHLRPDAEIGRWWSPLHDANEPTLKQATQTRQLGDEYKEGAIRARLSEEEAAKTKFYKPTAFDAMFFDPWQPPPKSSAWGFIRSQDGRVTIRETVTKPVKASNCEHLEVLPSEEAVAVAAGKPDLVTAIEALP